MSGRTWAALAVGATMCAVFTYLTNIYVGAAIGVLTALTTAFLIDSSAS